MKPNLVILTIGRCGSTILTRMLGQAGWNLPTDADEFAEPVYVRNVNERLIQKMPIDAEEFQAAIGMQQSPWVLKDPRFCWTLKHWRDWLADATLIYLTRDLEAVAKSLKKAGWGKETRQGMTLRGANLTVIEGWCKMHFEQWPGPKMEVSFEQIKSGINLFDLTRG